MRHSLTLWIVLNSLLLILAPEVSRGETKSLVIPAAAAIGVNEDADYTYFKEFGRYIPGDSCHVAPVYLPHGGGDTTVEVKEFRVYAIENNDSNTKFSLRRKEINSLLDAVVMADVTTTGTSTEVREFLDGDITNPIVSSNYTYYIDWCWNGLNDAQLQAFSISYTETPN